MTGLKIEFVEKKDGAFEYRRDLKGERITKLVFSRDKVIVNPVEPCNLPKKVTRFLEIHFSPLVIGPEMRKKVYVTFPVEIGVFLRAKGDFEALDVFSFCKPKYSLYGPPDSGVVTRWHESAVHTAIPDTDRMKEGVLELSVVNKTRSFAEVSRVVFDSAHMYLYYDGLVSLAGTMEIVSGNLAETSMKDRPLEQGMHNSIPLFTAKKLLMVEMEKPVFLMEHGFGEDQ